MIITSSNISSPFLIDVRKIVAQNLKSPREAYEFAQGLNFDLTKIPPEQQKAMISAISKGPLFSSSSHYSYSFAEGLNFDMTKITQEQQREIINAISKDSDCAYQFAKGINFDLTKIPPEIIDGISTDPTYSCLFAEGLKFDLTKLSPEQQKAMISAISKISAFSYLFAKGLLKLKFDITQIPSEIINGISKDYSFSLEFAEALGYNPELVPQVIQDRLLAGGTK